MRCSRDPSDDAVRGDGVCSIVIRTMRCSRDPSDDVVCGDGVCSIVIRLMFQDTETKKETEFTNMTSAAKVIR